MHKNTNALRQQLAEAQADIKEERGIIRNFDFIGFDLLEGKGLRAVISETEDGKRGVFTIEPIDALGGAND